MFQGGTAHINNIGSHFGRKKQSNNFMNQATKVDDLTNLFSKRNLNFEYYFKIYFFLKFFIKKYYTK